MKFYERYLAGETIAVYDDIQRLGDEAFKIDHKDDIEKVLTETFERVAFNLETIYTGLIDIGYLFKTDYNFNFEKPLHPPLQNTDALIRKIDLAVAPFGKVPMSLKFFYKIVGGVNFVWDFDTNDDFMWDMADPIQVASVDSIAEEVTSEYWLEEIQQYVDNEYFGCAFLDVSADDLHKDNVSGGQPYAIQITKKQAIDSNLLNEPNETTFINYLRICFENCGFPGITRPDLNNHYQSFFDKVKPKLKKI